MFAVDRVVRSIKYPDPATLPALTAIDGAIHAWREDSTAADSPEFARVCVGQSVLPQDSGASADQAARAEIRYEIALYEIPNESAAALAEFGIAPPAEPTETKTDANPLQLSQEQRLPLYTQLARLTKEGRAKLLAEPNLVTVPGREAFLHSGGEVPIPTKDTNGETGITLAKFGLNVKLLPRGIVGKRIDAQLAISVSELQPQAKNGLPPVAPVVTLLSAKHETKLAEGELLVLVLPRRTGNTLRDSFDLVLIGGRIVSPK